MNARKTTVTEMSYGRGWFLAGMVVLVACLLMFCSDAQALYSIFNSDGPYVYGLWGSNVQPAIGSEFGVVSAISSSYDAYGLYSDDGGVVISGVFGVAGTIIAQAAEEHAYGLYSDTGSITTDALNGTIVATAGYWRAVGLFTENDSITTGDIGGTITASAGGSSAFGLRSDYEGVSITTGDITGVITAVAGGDRAYGFRSYGTINIIGDINGVITATADGDYAVGMYASYDLTVDGDIGSDANIAATAGGDNAAGLYSADGSININGEINGRISATAQGPGNGTAYGLYADDNLTTGAINGTITAEMTNGSGAYALYAGQDLTVDGNISSTANISATAGDSSAYGLYSNSGTIYTGEINGTIAAFAETGDAAGLYSAGGSSIYTDAINGTITADANTGSDAYGLYADGHLDVDGIGENGEITATAGQNEAYGLYSQNGSIHIDDDMNGTITATAGNNYAAGLYSGAGDSIYTGAINGTITADANNYAYGLYADGDIDVDSIGSDAEITATAGDSYAYGLYSNGGTIYTGEINGTITAFAQTGNAAGLYTNGSTSIYTGAINGTITADANTGSNAYGLYANGHLDVDGIGENGEITATAEDRKAVGLYSQNGSIHIDGDMDGTITANAGERRAYGLFSDGGSINTGAINGTITATAGYLYAYGLYSSGGGSISTQAIDGDITATSDYEAYGLFSEGDSLTTGDIGGTITATVEHDRAYGLRSWGDITTGDIDGTISATGGAHKVAGLFSEGSLTTGAISGTIDANAGGDFAYGILSYGPMDVTIDGGTVSAVAHGGTNAAAIRSGRIASGPSRIDTKDANDTVEIVAGSTIVGDIDLARNSTDNDELWLTGDTGSTTLDDDINNVEHIYITGGTWYFNGNVYNSDIAVDGGILSGNGTLNFDVNVDNGGVLNPGGSIGSMTIDGDLTIGPGGTYEVDVNNGEMADNTVVTGTAYLDGTIRGNVYGGERIDHSFDVNVLDANTIDTIDNAFANHTGTTLFPIFDVRYEYDTDPCRVFLVVEMDYAHYADTDNQHSVGEAFNYIVTEGLDTGDMNDVLTAIEHLPDGDAVNKAYNQIMPQDALGQPEIIRNTMNQYSESIFGRMDNIRNNIQYTMSGDSSYLLASADNSAALPTKTDEWIPFAKGFGIWGDRETENDISGYRYHVYGISAGMDKLVSDNTLIGISVGGSWANLNYNQSGTGSDIDSAFCSLYGSYFVDDWHVGVTLGYGRSWYDSQRSITFTDPDRRAESEHQGDAYSAAVELGNNFGGTSMLLEPVVGLGYTAVRERGYTEKGAGDLNLKVDSDTTDGVYSKLGVRVAKEFRLEKYPDTIIVPKVSAFWIHDFAERVELSSSFVGGGSFTTEGHDPVRDMLNLGVGLNIHLKDNLRLFVDYGWQSASSFNSNTVQAGLQFSF